jgi:hypothetical protein
LERSSELPLPGWHMLRWSRPSSVIFEDAQHPRAPEKPGTWRSRKQLMQEISLLRRCVLAADIIVFAGLGYWLAATLAG